jgi:putative redox protein
MTNPQKFDPPSVPPGLVVVAEMKRDGLTQYLLDGRHSFSADEPVESGGADDGPNPYELLLMSLGACTSMTVRLFARRRNWPLERTIVRLRHSRVHAADCAHCEEKKSLLDHIDVEVELIGALTDPQRAQLKSIAEKCPVHRTLSSPISIVTTLASEQRSDLDARLDEALTETFPASDPTAVSPKP